ncbi:MAG TPA: DJ-1/PfpI family protein [Candidatus Eisenbacteria bacterium]|nr:DJ-1/PfpI family protein [Candidatus Eisenbacteria bacterium]
MNRRNVGILIFDDVEVLDFAGPFEVFSRTRLVPGPESRRSDDSAPFHVFTLAASTETVTATGGLRVVPRHDFASAPSINLLVVPGGFGTRTLLNDEPVIDWIRDAAEKAELVTSVCTGALLLARAGLLAGKQATTHWAALDLLAQVDPAVRVQRGMRVVRDGIVTSAGVSAGIDMALDVVRSLFGEPVAADVARYMEYERAGTPS